MKNPFQKRVHQPQNPMQELQRQEAEKQKSAQAARRKKVKEVLLPILFSEADSTLDGVIIANTMGQALETTVRNRLYAVKVGEFDREIAQLTNGKVRYQRIADALKEEKVSDALAILAELKVMVNDSLDQKFAKTPFKEFLADLKDAPSGKIILPS